MDVDCLFGLLVRSLGLSFFLSVIISSLVLYRCCSLFRRCAYARCKFLRSRRFYVIVVTTPNWKFTPNPLDGTKILGWTARHRPSPVTGGPSPVGFNVALRTVQIITINNTNATYINDDDDDELPSSHDQKNSFGTTIEYVQYAALSLSN